jgi:hypothetical protein
VLKSGRRDEPIRCVEADAFQLAVSFENAPAFRDSFGDWQDAASKPRAQLILKPLTQPSASVRLRMNSDAFADLAYGNDADVHQVVVGILQPLRHTWVRLWTGQLRGNIRVKEETPARPRSTGRPVD